MKENRVEVDGDSRRVELQLMFLREGHTIIVHAPALDLSAHGDTKEEALEAFGEILTMFIEDLIERDALDDCLESLGWTREDDHWIPPFVISQSTQTFELPM